MRALCILPLWLSNNTIPHCSTHTISKFQQFVMIGLFKSELTFDRKTSQSARWSRALQHILHSCGTSVLQLTSCQQGQRAMKDHCLRNFDFNARKLHNFSSANRSQHATVYQTGEEGTREAADLMLVSQAVRGQRSAYCSGCCAFISLHHFLWAELGFKAL